MLTPHLWSPAWQAARHYSAALLTGPWLIYLVRSPNQLQPHTSCRNARHQLLSTPLYRDPSGCAPGSAMLTGSMHAHPALAQPAVLTPRIPPHRVMRMGSTYSALGTLPLSEGVVLGVDRGDPRAGGITRGGMGDLCSILLSRRLALRVTQPSRGGRSASASSVCGSCIQDRTRHGDARLAR